MSSEAESLPTVHSPSGPTIVITYGWALGTPGGVARHLRELSRHLALAGARVILVYSKEEEAHYGLEGYFQRVEDFLTSYGLKVRTRSIDGELEGSIGPVIQEEGAQLLALGVHRDHFLSWLGDPLKIRKNFATRLLQANATSLFVVH